MHEITYLCDQFQRHTTDPSSADAQAFLIWLRRMLVGEARIAPHTEGPLPSGGFARPPRDPDGFVRLPFSQMEWWLETDEILGMEQQGDRDSSAAQVCFYRLPRTALALYRLAVWYQRQNPPRSAGTLKLLAKAWVSDTQAAEKGRLVFLVQGEDHRCMVLLACHADQPCVPDLFLDGTPMTLLARRNVPEVPEGGEDALGRLFFVDAMVALTWFIQHMVLRSWGQLFPLEDSGHARGEKRPSLPDLEKMKRYHAELQADATTPTLREEERQERLAFLMQATVQIQLAIPPGSIEALAQGLKNLLEKLQAPRDHLAPPQE